MPSANTRNQIVDEQLADEQHLLLTSDFQDTTTAHVRQISFPDNETIILSDVDFMSIFPNSLSAFPGLKSFFCSSCNLKQVPTSLFALNHLTNCELKNNDIREIPIQFESSLIETLNVAGNRFTSMPPQARTMQQLQLLDLSRNKITECTTPTNSADIKAHLQDSKLETLILDSNPITAFTCEFRNLVSLSLSRTSLTTIPPQIFKFTKLQQLRLSDNPLLRFDATSAPTSATNLSIKDLYLTACQLTEIPARLNELAPNLQTLSLANNNLQEQSTNRSSKMDQLHYLTLDGNKFTTLHSTLDRFPSLKNLSMVQNNITNCNVTETYNTLEVLNLSTNAIQECNLRTPKLKVLDLRHNRLGVVPPMIFELADLRILDLTENPLEPWYPTLMQLDFLNKLEELRIDQSTFASCNVSSQKTLQDGQYKVCVASEDENRNPTPVNQHPTEATHTRTSTSAQVLYLLGSLLLAVLIVVGVIRLLKRRLGSTSSGDSQETNGTITTNRAPVIASIALSPLSNSSRHTEHFSDSSTGRSGPLYSPDQAKFMSERDENGLPIRYPHSPPLPSSPKTTWADEELLSWRIEYNRVTMDKRLSLGVNTEVWRASYRTDTVVIKKLKPSIRLLFHHHPETTDTNVLDAFVFEVRLLSRVHHPRIVKFYGVAWTNESDLMMVMEYIPRLDLHAFLHKAASTSTPASPTARRSSFLGLGRFSWNRSNSKHNLNQSVHHTQSWSIEKLRIAQGVADALSSLHAMTPPIVHGNVQARNVLLDNEYQAKLCDFGAARYASFVRGEDIHQVHPKETGRRISDSNTTSMTPPADPSAWLAPELLVSRAKPELASTSMDIYSFGVLLSEIDTHQLPYSDGLSRQSISTIRDHVAKGTLRPTFSPSCPSSLREMAERCLAYEPSQRPTSAALVSWLQELIIEWENEDETKETEVRHIRPLGDAPTLEHHPARTSDSISLASDLSQHTIELV